MKKLIALSTLLTTIPFLFAGGTVSMDGDIMFYVFLSVLFLTIAGMIAVGRFLFMQFKTISWIPYPYFLYMYSFWRRYC